MPGATEDGRTRTFQLSLGETEFLEKGEIGVLSVVLTPLGSAGRAQVGELFQKSWDPLRYEEDPSGEATTAARGGYRVGTLELTLPPGEPTTQLFRDLAILKSRRQAPKRERDSSRWNRAVAVGGILQGLLDFQRIDDYELADVFAEVDIDAEDETMLAFHKGTLLSLAAAEPEEDEPTDQPGDDDAGAQDEPERVPPIGVDRTSRSRTSSSCTTSSASRRHD